MDAAGGTERDRPDPPVASASTKALTDAVRASSADLVAVRVPQLPLDTFVRWGDEARSMPDLLDDRDLEASLAADRRRLRERLAELLWDDHVRAAIAIAAPDLQIGLRQWRMTPDGRAGRAAERSLVRYLARIAARPTPFGIAAGYLLGELAGDPALRVEHRSEARLMARIDPSLLQAVVRQAAQARGRSDEQLVRRNPMLHRHGKRWRLTVRGNRPDRVRLVVVPSTPPLEQIMEAAASEVTVSELRILLERDGASPQAAQDALDGLIEREVLIFAPQITVTGADPTEQCLKALERTRGGAGSATIVRTAAGILAKRAPTEEGVIDAVTTCLRRLPVDVDPRRSIKVDTIRKGDFVVPAVVLAEARRAVALLARVAPPRRDRLAGFKQRLAARFGTRLVPLPEALDPDIGVMLEPEDEAGDPESEAKRRVSLLRLIARVGSASTDAVELTDQDLADLNSEGGTALPGAFDLVFSLVADDLTAVLRGDFMLAAPAVLGPPGARLLSRFCHGDDELTGRIRSHLRREEARHPDAIFAEVVCLPEDEWGLNVTHRPILREWEIPCGGLSGAPSNRQLEPSDLRVAVAAGEVVLWSERLKRRVYPRSTTAINRDRLTTPTARFLCSVADRGRGRITWSWGDLADAPALPRVQRGRIILARRRWNFTDDDIRALPTDVTAAGFRQLHEWRQENRLPRFVHLEHEKGPLLVDFANVLSVDAFLASARRLGVVRLVEATATAGTPLRGDDGGYAHEVVIAFTRPAERAGPRGEMGRRTVVPEPRRRFVAGSEWLFVKLYGSASAADRVLTGVVSPLTWHLRAADVIDRWFFVRYADPECHLRIRLHGRPEPLLRDALPALHDAVGPALEAGDLYRVCLDTYEREVERYGGIEGVELMEEIAEADSDAVLTVLARETAHPSRRHLATASVYLLYGDTGLDLATRERCCARLRTLLGPSKGGGLAVAERLERPGVEALLASLDDPRAVAPVLATLRGRSEVLARPLADLRALSEQGRLEESFEEVVASHAHMFVNRLLGHGGLHQELRIHDCLARVYKSRLARERAATGS